MLLRLSDQRFGNLPAVPVHSGVPPWPAWEAAQQALGGPGFACLTAGETLTACHPFAEALGDAHCGGCSQCGQEGMAGGACSGGGPGVANRGGHGSARGVAKACAG